MGSTTKISWCDSTFNPWIGCTKISPACANCYAADMMHRWGKDLWGPGKPRQRTSAANWRQPLKWEAEAARTGIRRKVFCGSLCDWLDPEAPIEWIADLLDLIRQTPHLDWLLLTKRPEMWSERVVKVSNFMPRKGHVPCFTPKAWEKDMGLREAIQSWTLGDAPANVWIGATVENQEMADKRIPELLKIPARVRFLSCEPLLGPVDLLNPCGSKVFWIGAGVHWVICGGEGGPHARPMHPDWARSLRDQCKAAGVAYFFKQWGEWLPCIGILQEQPYKNHYEKASDGKVLMVRGEPARQVLDDKVVAFRVGKARAGCLLDGVEHQEFPRAESEVTNA